MFTTSVRRSFFVALACTGVAAVTGCDNPGPVTQTDQASGALQGELSAVSVMDSYGGNSTAYFLKQDRVSVPTQLFFDIDPNLPSGTTVRVWGTEDGGAIRVGRH